MKHYKYIVACMIGYHALCAIPSAHAAPLLEHCQTLSEDLPAANDCYYEYAITSKDVTICDRIMWSPKTAICRQKLLVHTDVFTLPSLLSSPIFWLIVAWGIVFFFRPPHLVFIYSAFIALPWYGMFLVFSAWHLPFPLLSNVIHFIFYTVLDPFIVSLQTYIIHLPFTIAYITCAAFYTSIVFGLAFQWTKSSLRLLCVLLFLSIIPHFYAAQTVQVVNRIGRLILLLLT